MKRYIHPNYSYVTVVEILKTALKKVDFCKCAEPKETLISFYNRQKEKPDVLINGGFFALSTGEPVFPLIDEGVVRSTGEHNNGYGIKENDNMLTFGNIHDYDKWKDFIGGYPVLVGDYEPVEVFYYANEINYNARRTMLGDNDTTIFIVTVDSPGMNFKSMTKLMAGIGCKYAINLDGGGSTRMLIDGKVANKPSENRAVDNVVAFYLKKDEPIEEEDDSYDTYIVKGDLLIDIANKYNVSVDDITEFNNIADNRIYVGQELKIPKYIIHIVKSGDSLWKIAQMYLGSGSRYPEIMEYNGLKSTSLYVGQEIKIPYIK